MKHVFKKPFNFEGTEYKEIELDFDSLTGADLEKVEREVASAGMQIMNFSTSQTGAMYVAARAAKQPVEFMKALPLREASAIATKTQNFLLDMESIMRDLLEK